MAGPVHVVPPEGVLLDQLIDVALEQAQLHHALGENPHRLLVQALDGFARPDRRDAGVGRVEHELVAGTLGGAEPPRSGEGAGHVGGIQVILGAGVDQHQIAVADLHAVVVVVEDGGVLARRHDRVIAPAAAAGLAEFTLEQRVQVVLVHPRAPRLHRGDMAFARQLDRFAERVQLPRFLPQPQLVDDLAGILDARRSVHSGARASAQRAQHPGDESVELRVVSTEAIEERARRTEQLRQLLVELADLERLVGPEALDRPFRSRAPPRPDLLLLVARAYEERERFVAARGEDHHRFRLFESGQPVHVAVGAVRMLDVAVPRGDRRCRKDRHRRTWRHFAHAAEHLVAAGSVDAGLERGGQRHARCCNRTFPDTGCCGSAG